MNRAKSKDKRRFIAAGISLVLIVAIMLTGTFAWQSISQNVVNEVGVKGLNVGGRLHDDFNGEENKDIYVENFGNEPILARIRLDEYMEIGAGAGRKGEQQESNQSEPVVEGTELEDQTTWTTHIPNETGVTDCDTPTSKLHEYFEWEMGGSTIFMPTFNKNKDSLKSDVNGTFAGPDGDPSTKEDRFEDYQEYTDQQKVTSNAVYDADDNTVDEGDGGAEGVNHKTIEETHTAKPTQTGTVITMAKWKEDGSQPGKYWVYDTDGWAYWAEAIQPGEATGLLLSKISLKQQMSDDWYYRINAVAQFATDDDLGDDTEDTGFYEDGLTDDAYYLLMTAAGHKETVEITTAGDADKCLPGNTLQFTAKITLGGRVFGPQEVNWSISSAHNGSTSINNSGLLTVAAGETNEELTIKAASKTKPELFTEKTVKTGKTYEEIGTITPGSTETVGIDGIQWYVLAKDDGKALIWTKDIVERRKFDSSTNVWKDSGLRTYLNGDWLDGKATLQEKAVQTDITTRIFRTDTFNTTQDKVFLLSEADLFGTHSYGQTPTDSKDYTYNGQVLVPNIEMRKSSTTCWLRSPYSSTFVNVVYDDGTLSINNSYSTNGVRPALWITMP